MSTRPPAQGTPSGLVTPPSPATNIPDFGMTMEECLHFAPLDTATVVGGQAGLSRRMNWVHVVDHRDLEDSIKTHELLLTSGIALAGDELLQREIFEIMDRKQSAGLGIAIGDYVKEIPAQMRELADVFEIPLLAIPWEINFGDITRVLLSELVETQYHFMEVSQELNEKLLQVVLESGDLDAVCQCISRVAGVAAAICDDSFRLLASSPGPMGTSLNEQALPAALSLARFNRSGPGAYKLLTIDGQTMGVVAPIVVGARCFGYVALEIAGLSPGFAGRLAEGAATATALVTAHEEDLLRVARRTDGQLLGLLDGSLPPSIGVLSEIGLKTVDPVYVLLADIEDGEPGAAQELMRGYLRARCSSCALAVRGQSVVGLVQNPRSRTSEWSSGLLKHLRKNGLQPVIGLSTPTGNFNDIAARHQEVRELLRLRQYLQPDEDIVNAEYATVLLRTLSILVENSDLDELCSSIIKIKERDRSQQGSLIEALDCLLEVDWNVSLAARRLGIHRHTMLYRLERIGEILGTELKSSMRFELRLQLLAWRIAGRS